MKQSKSNRKKKRKETKRKSERQIRTEIISIFTLDKTSGVYGVHLNLSFSVVKGNLVKRKHCIACIKIQCKLHKWNI